MLLANVYHTFNATINKAYILLISHINCCLLQDGLIAIAEATLGLASSHAYILHDHIPPGSTKLVPVNIIMCFSA